MTGCESTKSFTHGTEKDTRNESYQKAESKQRKQLGEPIYYDSGRDDLAEKNSLSRPFKHRHR